MLSLSQMKEVVEWTACEPYAVTLFRSDGGLYMQVSAVTPDPVSGELTQRRGAKLQVSKYSTESELVQKALGAVLAFSEHEIREHFSYRGVHLFNPHIDVRAHMEIADRQVFRDEHEGST